jgi:hypothetical protein
MPPRVPPPTHACVNSCMKSTMRHLGIGLLLGSALSIVTAQAQVYREGPYGRGGYRDDRGYGRGDAINRTLSDINRVRSYGWSDRRERKHLDQAERELVKFQDKLVRGRFDYHHLDQGIEHLNRALNSYQMNPRDRDVLARDLITLRDFRNGGRGYYDRR